MLPLLHHPHCLFITGCKNYLFCFCYVDILQMHPHSCLCVLNHLSNQHQMLRIWVCLVLDFLFLFLLKIRYICTFFLKYPVKFMPLFDRFISIMIVVVSLYVYDSPLYTTSTTLKESQLPSNPSPSSQSTL